jgi:hypothetical protein
MPTNASISMRGGHGFGRGIGLRLLALAAAGFMLVSCASSAALNESHESAQNSGAAESDGAPDSKMLTQYVQDDFRQLGIALFLR